MELGCASKGAPIWRERRGNEAPSLKPLESGDSTAWPKFPFPFSPREIPARRSKRLYKAGLTGRRSNKIVLNRISELHAQRFGKSRAG